MSNRRKIRPRPSRLQLAGINARSVEAERARQRVRGCTCMPTSRFGAEVGDHVELELHHADDCVLVLAQVGLVR